jgi:predicted CopG family antitoxin
MSTVIRVRKKTVEELQQLKIHYRETYDDVIKRLIEAWRRREVKCEST